MTKLEKCSIGKSLDGDINYLKRSHADLIADGQPDLAGQCMEELFDIQQKLVAHNQNCRQCNEATK